MARFDLDFRPSDWLSLFCATQVWVLDKQLLILCEITAFKRGIFYLGLLFMAFTLLGLLCNRSFHVLFFSSLRLIVL
jgi:hypothetical protein